LRPIGRGGFAAMANVLAEFSLPVRVQATGHSVPVCFLNETERLAGLKIADLLRI
jgi:hypothetical protein